MFNYKYKRMSFKIIIASIMLIIFVLSIILFGELNKAPMYYPVQLEMQRHEIPAINLMDLFAPIRIFRINPEHFIRQQRRLPKKDRKRPKKYFNDLEDHSNDPQNAHDHQVIISLKEKYQRLTELHKDGPEIDELKKAGLSDMEIREAKIMDSINEIYQYALKKLNNDDKKKIEEVLTEISKGYTITSLDNNGVKESWILTLIWERINHPENEKNRENMKEALLYQLIDCIQTTQEMFGDIIQIITPLGDAPHVVCINGRIARLISSLSLLDEDPILNKPELDEKEISNLAYMKAYSILQKNLKRKVPKNRGFQRLEGKIMEEIYIKDPDKLEDDEKKLLKHFESHVKKEITHSLKKEYQEIVSSKLLNEIIEKSLMGI